MVHRSRNVVLGCLVAFALAALVSGCTEETTRRRHKSLKDNRSLIVRVVGFLVPGGGKAADGVIGGTLALMAWWADRKRRQSKAKDTSLDLATGAIETGADQKAIKGQLAKVQDPHIEAAVRRRQAAKTWSSTESA